MRIWRTLRVRTGCLDGLDFLWLEITRSCNLACVHCYAGSGPELPIVEEMQLEDWFRVMDEARDLGCRNVQFIGGEPTIHPGLEQLVEHAKEKGFRFCEIFTNAANLSEPLLDTLEESRSRVAVSFYSARPEVHDRITGHEGSFRRTVDGIRSVVRRRIPIRAEVIRLQQSRVEVWRAKWLLRGLGVWNISSDRVRGVGRGRDFVPNTRETAELCGRCWNGRLAIDAAGRAYPCVFARSRPIGQCREARLHEIVGGRPLRSFREAQYMGT